jgi:hypothetical protein
MVGEGKIGGKEILRSRLEQLWEEIEEARLRRSPHLVVELVVVTKYLEGVEPLKWLMELGQRAFGENRVQQLEQKARQLEGWPVEWHFIGNLQRNKINKLLRLNPFLIQSISSFKLAEGIDKRASRPVAGLLEINSSGEPTKGGCRPEEAVELYLKIQEECPNLQLKGVMTIGAHTDDEREIRKSFQITYRIFEELQKYGAKICSMGMSNDFQLAIEEGSNMVRIGSRLFRNLPQV